MALTICDKPQLNYNGGFASKYDSVDSRFPKGARPISEAPTASATPSCVYEPSGEGHRAIYHRGQWMKVFAERDPYTGQDTPTHGRHERGEKSSGVDGGLMNRHDDEFSRFPCRWTRKCPPSAGGIDTPAPAWGT